MIVKPKLSNILIYNIKYETNPFVSNQQGGNIADVAFKNSQTGQRFIASVDMNSSMSVVKTMIGNRIGASADKIQTKVSGMRTNNADSLNHHNILNNTKVSFSIKD